MHSFGSILSSTGRLELRRWKENKVETSPWSKGEVISSFVPETIGERVDLERIEAPNTLQPLETEEVVRGMME